MKDILKEFRLKLWNVSATIFQSSLLYDEKQLKEKEDVMVKFLEEAIDQTREETIREMEEKEIEIQNILEPYFVVLDGRDNEPSQETIIEISKKILDILYKLKK